MDKLTPDYFRHYCIIDARRRNIIVYGYKDYISNDIYVTVEPGYADSHDIRIFQLHPYG